ncbi:FKBP-type peptidyl-prolyl cis-trans isomerase [Fodinibius sediminis]|uniref:Peptidyl-prolyl cis-trans isomerase n=1 Tax=Fodinibius sediminis TaxID=1214077 RepID=A0A521AZQ4_9BACT|nr:FKBP-type peptidyl-prolyl cis-trans isomerase [Fodinibius sediminis]SMO40286.1 FKBP-type peptidyl-prolyl cis-trans isomerase FkpA/FKBP-type peptidyl-prolyl cis-trans isomerase FklB [Fodinibius sediminis]
MISQKITLLFSMLFGAILFSFAGCNSDSGSATTDVSLETNIDSVSYSLGYQIASMSLKRQGMTDINADKFASGLKSALEDKDAAISQSEMQQVVQSYQMKAQQQAQQQQQQEAQENKKKEEEFLAENKNNEGVQVTESGLQYRILEEGSGVSPDSSDEVRVHYEGTLLDGTQFDSSYERGEPVEFPLNQVIPGWTEGLQLMKEGGKYKFWIPSALGYGPNPRPGGPIGPNETLIFEVELLEVNPSDSASAN